MLQVCSLAPTRSFNMKNTYWMVKIKQWSFLVGQKFYLIWRFFVGQREYYSASLIVQWKAKYLTCEWLNFTKPITKIRESNDSYQCVLQFKLHVGYKKITKSTVSWFTTSQRTTFLTLNKNPFDSQRQTRLISSSGLDIGGFHLWSDFHHIWTHCSVPRWE